MGSNNVVRMRSKVDLPAPLAPTSARISPALTWKEIPRRAGTLSRDTGCKRARHPLDAGGKYFSRFSTRSEGSFTKRSYILSNAMKQGPWSRPEACHSDSDCGCRCGPKPLQSLTLVLTLSFWMCSRHGSNAVQRQSYAISAPKAFAETRKHGNELNNF